MLAIMDATGLRMKPFERRALTRAEIELARPLFGEEIAWPYLRVWQLPPLTFAAMAPWGRGVVFSRWRAWRDFACAPLDQQGWFMHELAHVWQGERGVMLPLAKLGALGAGAYAYTPQAGALLSAYNIERQAEIVRHLFLARAGAPAEGAPQLGWLERVWGGR